MSFLFRMGLTKNLRTGLRTRKAQGKNAAIEQPENQNVIIQSREEKTRRVLQSIDTSSSEVHSHNLLVKYRINIKIL